MAQLLCCARSKVGGIGLLPCNEFLRYGLLSQFLGGLPLLGFTEPGGLESLAARWPPHFAAVEFVQPPPGWPAPPASC